MGRAFCVGEVFILRRFVAVLFFVPLLFAGCGDSGNLEVSTDDIDPDAPIYITDSEYASFREPADAVLTPDQVTAYLRTSLLQFDYIREQSEGLRENVRAMESRQEEGGMLNQFRNLVDAGRTMYQTADLVGGSYIRSSRALGYNPAEMEWVRDQFLELAGYLTLLPIYEQAAVSAQGLRQQAEELRSGTSANESAVRDQADALLAMADDLENNARQEIPRALQQNLEMLRSVRPSVTNEMWSAIGLAGGASGLLAFAGLGEPDNRELNARLDDLRALYEAVLENRATEIPSGLR